MYKSFFLFLSLIKGICANPEEKYLFNNLFINHKSNVRPVLNYNDSIEVQVGMGMQTIESFDQKEEAITLNVWERINWKDETLNWDSSFSNLTVITLNPNEIWTPDLELLNAATKPIIYTLEGGLYLYSDGSVTYSKPTILKFSCPLELEKFPFDTQICTMNISSWVYTNDLLNLIPNTVANKQVDILDTFRHSEWDIINSEVNTYTIERDCCIGKEFNIISYSFTLQRFTHYYKISMGMTITLVIVSFIIMLMPGDNVSRTGTAVFIPLTILALQLTLADKIPIVGYYTLMDYFFLLCFITSMLCSIESGLIYSLLTSNSPKFYDWLDRKFDVLKNNINSNDNNSNDNNSNNYNNSNNDNSNNDNNSNDNRNTEFINVINELNETNTDISDTRSLNEEIFNTISGSDNINIRSKSYNSGMKKYADLRKRTPTNIENNSLGDRKSLRDDFLEENKIQKIINYDDKKLYLTDDQILIDIIVNKYINKVDNGVRIFLPLLFFTLIIVIMSYEN